MRRLPLLLLLLPGLALAEELGPGIKRLGNELAEGGGKVARELEGKLRKALGQEKPQPSQDGGTSLDGGTPAGRDAGPGARMPPPPPPPPGPGLPSSEAPPPPPPPPPPPEG